MRNLFAAAVASAVLASVSVGSFADELVAFPGAEGYGRLAKGGRGGTVIAVTNLDDYGSKDPIIPGSLRAAIESTGPRTIVFNVGGTIQLIRKLVIKKENGRVTVAGQTAPGKGIMVRDYTFGMTGPEDVVLRFIRTRVGTTSGDTMDGMGLTAANNSIVDHCSISWTMDEGFSSRQAKNITLQRTMIAESLNVAGHRKYGEGIGHSFAASINGDIGSFHHNLLAHNAGRNWSMAGGLTKDKPMRTLGDLDLRNNVVYNWVHRTTDGEIHKVNFVNNYYKPGPSTKYKKLMKMQFYHQHDDLTTEYYMSGNIMEGVIKADDPIENVYAVDNGPKVPYDYISEKELFEPHVTTQTAEEAYKDVLANVGCNVPMLDDHDKRIIEEVKTGTTTYKGSKTGLAGIIDNEADAGGFEVFEVVNRPADWDTDADGMPGEWEKKHGLNPNDPADGNKTNLSADGYTNLEMYLNALARDPVKWKK